MDASCSGQRRIKKVEEHLYSILSETDHKRVGMLIWHIHITLLPMVQREPLDVPNTLDIPGNKQTSICFSSPKTKQVSPMWVWNYKEIKQNKKQNAFCELLNQKFRVKHLNSCVTVTADYLFCECKTIICFLWLLN